MGINPHQRPPGAGRKKGVPNKLTTDMKATIVAAFVDAGGKDYLVKVAKTDPRTFCWLLDKILPTQVTGIAADAHQGSGFVAGASPEVIAHPLGQ